MIISCEKIFLFISKYLSLWFWPFLVLAIIGSICVSQTRFFYVVNVASLSRISKWHQALFYRCSALNFRKIGKLCSCEGNLIFIISLIAAQVYLNLYWISSITKNCLLISPIRVPDTRNKHFRSELTNH